MLNLQRKTALSPGKVTERLKSFFGEGGLGLTLRKEKPPCLTFEGGGGYVTASVCESEGKTEVQLVTQEWEAPVKEFASRLP